MATERSRQISPREVTAPSPISHLPPTHTQPGKGSSENSSVEKASSTGKPSSSFTPSKPTLEKPKSGVPRILGMIPQWESIGSTLAELTSDRIQTEGANIKRTHLDEAAKMDEALELSKQVGFWGILEDVGNLFTGAVSTTLGYSIASTASPVAGGMLIGAGILSLTNITMKHLEGWDWLAGQIAGDDNETKEQISTYLPAALGITSTALGLAGTFGGWYFGGLSEASQAISMLQTAANLSQAGISMQSAYHGSQQSWTSAEISYLQSMAKFYKIHLENAMDEMKEFSEQQMQFTGLAGELLRARKRAIQVTHQVV